METLYRHLQTLSSTDIYFDPVTRYIDYPRDPRENNDAIEAGFSYTTRKRKVTYAFYTRTVVDGNNSDQKFWIGGYMQMPFSLFTPKKPEIQTGNSQ